MPIVQVAYDVPMDVYKGLLDGSLKRMGSVAIRDGKGIVKHVKEVEVLKDIPKPRLADVLAENKLAVIGIGAVTIVGGVATALITDAIEEKRKMRKLPKCFERYLDELQEGDLDVFTINEVINFLEDWDEKKEKEVGVKLTNQQWDALMNIVYDYTKKLSKANHYSTRRLRKPFVSKKETKVIKLQSYLDTQKRIFEEVG